MDRNLFTWGEIDISLVEKAYDFTKSHIAYKMCDSTTMKIIVELMESQLPEDYWVKCDLELNPPEVIDSGNIIAKVIKNTYPIGSHNYVDVIF